MSRLLLRNRIFTDRMRGVGVLPKELAISLSTTGPMARASGVTRDLRKDEPYLAYPELEFDVPYATEGDCYARFQVRMEEMNQSLRIIEQAVDKLPGRAGQRADRREVPPAGQGHGVQQHGGPDPALRADHAQPRHGEPEGRDLRGRREPQRRAGLLPRRRRQPDRLAGPHPAAVVHPLRRSSRTSSRTT